MLSCIALRILSSLSLVHVYFVDGQMEGSTQCAEKEP